MNQTIIRIGFDKSINGSSSYSGSRKSTRSLSVSCGNRSRFSSSSGNCYRSLSICKGVRFDQSLSNSKKFSVSKSVKNAH